MGGCKLGPLRSRLKSHLASPVAGTASSQDGQSKQPQAVLASHTWNQIICSQRWYPKVKKCYTGGEETQPTQRDAVPDERKISFAESTQAFSKLKKGSINSWVTCNRVRPGSCLWVLSTCKSSKGRFQHYLPRFPLQFIWESCAQNTFTNTAFSENTNFLCYLNSAVGIHVLSSEYILISLHKIAIFSLDLNVWRSLSGMTKWDLPYYVEHFAQFCSLKESNVLWLFKK